MIQQLTPKQEKEELAAHKRLMKKLRDPKEARALLLRAGIAVRSKTAPNGIRLAKRYR